MISSLSPHKATTKETFPLGWKVVPAVDHRKQQVHAFIQAEQPLLQLSKSVRIDIPYVASLSCRQSPCESQVAADRANDTVERLH